MREFYHSGNSYMYMFRRIIEIFCTIKIYSKQTNTKAHSLIIWASERRVEFTEDGAWHSDALFLRGRRRLILVRLFGDRLICDASVHNRLSRLISNCNLRKSRINWKIWFFRQTMVYQSKGRITSSDLSIYFANEKSHIHLHYARVLRHHRWWRLPGGLWWFTGMTTVHGGYVNILNGVRSLLIIREQLRDECRNRSDGYWQWDPFSG